MALGDRRQTAEWAVNPLSSSRGLATIRAEAIEPLNGAEETGSGYAIGAAAADFDNDGFVDLFVAGVNECRLYRNLGRGPLRWLRRAN